MKMFRMIGLVLLTAFLCINFVGCNNDGDGLNMDEEGVVINEKKMVEIKCNYTDVPEVYTFTYDHKGHLASMRKNIYGSISTCSYFWTGNTIVETGEYNTCTYSLVDGLINSINYDSEDYYNVDYNSSKRMSTLKYYSSKNYASVVDTFTWENGKIVKVESEDKYDIETYEMAYGEDGCKGFSPFVLFVLYNDIKLLLPHPELLGARFNKLPCKRVYKLKEKNSNHTSEKVWDISYTYDSDGYVTSCMLKSEKPHLNYSYSFKWE